MTTTTYRHPPERLYKIPLTDGWFEVSSFSDGMCGSVTVEHPKTRRMRRFHWSITSLTSESQSEARDAARAWIASGCPDDVDGGRS